MARMKQFTISPDTADADGICESQTIAAAGDLTLDGTDVSGGIVTFSYPSRVVVANAGTESSVVVTVYGTAANGGTVNESITLTTPTTRTTAKSFETVTRVATDTALSGNVTVGNSDSVNSKPIVWDHYMHNRTIGMTPVNSADFTYKLQHTMDDIQLEGTDPSDVTWYDDATVTSSTQGDIELRTITNTPYVASRVVFTSFVAGGLEISAVEQ